MMVHEQVVFAAVDLLLELQLSGAHVYVSEDMLSKMLLDRVVGQQVQIFANVADSFAQLLVELLQVLLRGVAAESRCDGGDPGTPLREGVASTDDLCSLRELVEGSPLLAAKVCRAVDSR